MAVAEGTYVFTTLCGQQGGIAGQYEGTCEVGGLNSLK